MRENLSGNLTYLVQYINHGGLTLVVSSMLNVKRNIFKNKQSKNIHCVMVEQVEVTILIPSSLFKEQGIIL